MKESEESRTKNDPDLAFTRFAKVLRALIAVPKSELEQKLIKAKRRPDRRKLKDSLRD
jgi:hypothetical protein